MILGLPSSPCSAIAAVLYGTWLAIAPISDSSSSFLVADQSYVPILEVIKVYGKMAGPACFGKMSPNGSSCQVTRDEFDSIIGSSLSKEQLATTIMRLEFQWPLKPYGVEKSEFKTAIMNKGAETRLYMEELEQRGLYDRRNPTGPLPTSLRPNLNRILQQEGVSQDAIDLFYDRLAGGGGAVVAGDALFQGRQAIDYYDFLEFLGKNSITWN
mmetsp:Transcript_23437/g.44579  ORF Transcript_23437/g.44579 Transcript_23437/m.44579 type:complete len:213 (-) Transcript_23437:68-706(-)|eukprot:scaffold710_cov171-Amphora_coffeaeformis.AAC.17